MCFERAAINAFHYESVVLIQVFNETHHVGMFKVSKSMEVLHFNLPHFVILQFVISPAVDLDGEHGVASSSTCC